MKTPIKKEKTEHDYEWDDKTPTKIVSIASDWESFNIGFRAAQQYYNQKIAKGKKNKWALLPEQVVLEIFYCRRSIKIKQPTS